MWGLVFTTIVCILSRLIIFETDITSFTAKSSYSLTIMRARARENRRTRKEKTSEKQRNLTRNTAQKETHRTRVLWKKHREFDQ